MGAGIGQDAMELSLLGALRAGGNPKRLRALLSSGANPSEKDKNDVSALSIAVGAGLAECCSILLAAGADARHRALLGSHPLCYAAASSFPGALDCLRQLLALPDERLWISARGDFGKQDILQQALYYCAEESRSEPMARALLAAGASLHPDPKGHAGITPGICLSAHGATEDRLGQLRFWLDLGASVEARNEYGETPLMSCASQADTPGVIFLISRGADIHARDEMGRDALTHARRCGLDGSEACQGTLMAFIEARDLQDRTPAARSGPAKRASL